MGLKSLIIFSWNAFNKFFFFRFAFVLTNFFLEETFPFCKNLSLCVRLAIKKTNSFEKTKMVHKWCKLAKPIRKFMYLMRHVFIASHFYQLLFYWFCIVLFTLCGDHWLLLQKIANQLKYKQRSFQVKSKQNSKRKSNK